jgi:carbonic anhydrase
LLKNLPQRAGEFIGPWIRIAERVRTHVLECNPEDPQLAGEHGCVRLSVGNLLSFPWIAERVADGRLRVHGAHFDIRTGVLAMLQADGSFAAV